ncbi:hypothetical protein DENSPDRAFT_743280, partial [Dentipellis sp. KUC8613]
MSTQSLSTDTLPSSVPKLNTRGANWAIFSACFQIAIEAKGKWGHFDGTEPRPVFTDSPLTETQADQLAVWEKDEWTARYLLTQCLPDATLVRMQKFLLVAEKWTAIVQEYMLKGTYAQTDMHRKFME